MKKGVLANLPWGNWKEIVGDLLVISVVGLVLTLSLLVFEYGVVRFVQKISEML